MSLIKLSSEILDIKGRFGGVYYARDKSGLHIRARPRFHAYPHTKPQSPGIGGFSVASAFWHLLLLSLYGAAWATFALIHLFRGKDGREKHITGFNWYIYYALIFPEAESFPLWAPPHTPTRLPEYVATYDGTWQYHHLPEQWPVWCPGGYYWQMGIYNGKDYYRTDDWIWFLWWKDPQWVLSRALGGEDPFTTYYYTGVAASGWYYNAAHDRWTHVYLGYVQD